MTIFDEVIIKAAETTASAGQRKTAEFAYNVLRKRFMKSGKRDVPTWSDLSHTEQSTWMACVWEQLEEDRG